MKILLLGEYSHVHWTLAEGLRQLGHDVTVASDGDGWKNYPRNIDLRRSSSGPIGTLSFLFRLVRNFHRMKGYDVVQIINPVFLELKAERILPVYRYLRRHNRHIFMGAFGMDYYWVKYGTDCSTFRYSDFNLGALPRKNADNDRFIREWRDGQKGILNRFIANDCDGIISGLYEYDECYRREFPGKTCFIPFPIDCRRTQFRLRCHKPGSPVSFFIGIQSTRNVYKGTDIMYRALLRLKERYPNQVRVVKAESVPFAQYAEMLDNSDVLLDQLYSYTPAMNGLLAMAKGMVLVGGGEPENYAILHETSCFPIVNVQPDEDDVYRQLEQLVLHPEQLTKRSAESRTYIETHHDHLRVAQQYINFWTRFVS